MIRKQVTLAGLQNAINTLPFHMEETNKQMLAYYMDKIIVRHFQIGNEQTYKYKALDPKYLARKQKKYGNQPMLVATGKLRDDTIARYKIHRLKGKYRIILNIPKYGKYVKVIRDFTVVGKKDMKDMLRYWKRSLTIRRKKYIESVSALMKR